VDQLKDKMTTLNTFNTQFDKALDQMESEGEMAKMKALLGSDLFDQVIKVNFFYIRLYMERLLTKYTLNNELWTIYIEK
jgi:hypothetical protein